MGRRCSHFAGSRRDSPSGKRLGPRRRFTCNVIVATLYKKLNRRFGKFGIYSELQLRTVRGGLARRPSAHTSQLMLAVPEPLVHSYLLIAVFKWRIQLWAHRAAAPPLHPPIDQNLGPVMAARVRHGGKFSLKSLTFGHFLYKNVQKAFSFSRWGLRPQTPV